MIEEQVRKDRIRGRARIVRLDEHGMRRLLTPFRPNLIMADWASIFVNFAATGSAAYRISGMYLEYDNVNNPDDVVTPPAFQEIDGISYYDGLAAHPTRDYLRVSLAGANVSTTDISQWPSGNVIQLFALSTGVVAGTHGKAFSDTVNSKLFGAALVAMRSPDDATQDLILSRLYFDGDDQQVKLATSQLGVDWAIELN